MKRICSVFAAIVTLFSVFSFSGCGETDTIETIELTTENYKKYLAINTYFDDYHAISLGTGVANLRAFCLFCRGNISIKKRVDCIFKNVTIYLLPEIIGWDTDSNGITVELPFDGEILASFSASTNEYISNDINIEKNPEYPSSRYTHVKITKIYGQVIIKN